jgi:hypothetical protein
LARLANYRRQASWQFIAGCKATPTVVSRRPNSLFLFFIDEKMFGSSGGQEKAEMGSVSFPRSRAGTECCLAELFDEKKTALPARSRCGDRICG